MRCSKSCGISFMVFAGIECLLEIILSGAIGALCVFSWIKEGKPTSFLYDGGKLDNYIVRNNSLEACVGLWCLTIIMAICIWRIISAVVLFFCVKRNSAALGHYWLLYKMLALLISIFVGVASFTVPTVKLVALLSCGVELITSYFMILLYPELERMKRSFTVADKNKDTVPN